MANPAITDPARRFVDLLRDGADDAATLAEFRHLMVKLSIDPRSMIRFSSRLLNSRSIARRTEAADTRAAKVRLVIDDIRLLDADASHATIAVRLNDRGIPAPRGGKWMGAQVYRVLKRTDRASS